MLGDDIVMSFCGAARPECHDVGKLLNCPTYNVPGIAVFKKQGFRTSRLELYSKVMAMYKSNDYNAPR